VRKKYDLEELDYLTRQEPDSLAFKNTICLIGRCRFICSFERVVSYKKGQQAIGTRERVPKNGRE